jgi:hypothetical protein
LAGAVPEKEEEEAVLEAVEASAVCGIGQRASAPKRATAPVRVIGISSSVRRLGVGLAGKVGPFTAGASPDANGSFRGK